jgi:predicted phage tail protein
LLVTIKPHSSFSKFFSEKEYIADLKSYNDIFFYLNGMHKRFITYLRQQKAQGIEESFVFLDKDLRIISPDELQIKHAREGDIIHIVPAVVGGGGKRGGILATLAVAFFFFVGLPFLSPAAPAAGAGAAGAAGAAGTAGTAAAGATLSKTLTSLAINLSLSLISSLFASNPKEEQTRQNDMFGSLTNSTSSGTPIALNYGLMRVAGQMINGYVLSVAHTKTQNMNIYGEIIETEATSAVEQQAVRSEFLSGFNSFT